MERRAAWLSALLLLPSWALQAVTGQDFLLALKHRDLAAIRMLADEGVDVNQTLDDGKTALMIAALAGRADLAAALIAAGAAVNAQNRSQGTALMFAAVHGDPATLRVLLSKGAAVDARGWNGWTAIMYASAKGHGAAVKELLKYHAQANIRDIYGWTPLARAVNERRVEVVEVLLESGLADVDTQDDHGATALHHAAENGFPEMARLLLAHGADAGATDLEGRTPTMVASLAGHLAVVDAIRAARRPGAE